MGRKFKASVLLILGGISWFIVNVAETWLFDRVFRLEPEASRLLPYFLQYGPLVVLVSFAAWIWFGQSIMVWFNNIGKSIPEGESTAASVVNERVSFIWLMSEISKRGRDFEDKSSGILSIANELRQAGLDGRMTFWGRPNRFEMEKLVREEPLNKIPSDHWKDFRIHWPAAFELDFSKSGRVVGIESDNFPVGTYSLSASNEKSRRYMDLHMDRLEALAWLKGRDGS